MGASDTTERWIDSKCAKHTPTETRRWIRDSWTKSVLPEFKKLRAAIADTSVDVPNDFFMTNGLRHGNTNPLFLFLRPKKLLYIAVALEDSKQVSLVKILDSFLQEWDDCLVALKERYPQNQAAARCSHSLQRTVELFSSLCNTRKHDIKEERYREYIGVYSETCDAFNDIPTDIAVSEQMIDAVKKALKLTSGKPQIKKLVGKTERQEAKMAKFIRSKKLEKRKDIIDTYKETIACNKIVYSEYAKSIGAQCSQTKGTFTLRGLGKTYRISNASIIPWLVLRLFLKSKDKNGITQLYPGWDGPFGNAPDDRHLLRKELIVAAGESKRKNNKLYRLISAQEMLKRKQNKQSN